jgi:carbonic anhydrase
MGDADRAQLALEWTKRDAMFGVAALIATRALAAAHDGRPDLTPSAALKRLQDGNARYAAGKPARRVQSPAGRREPGLPPFAAIVACAYSGVAPETIFDQERGDLHVIRVAGNTVDETITGTVEASVIRFDLPLVMVLGCQAAAPAARAVPAPTPAVLLNTRHAATQLFRRSRAVCERVKSGRLQVVSACYGLDSGKVSDVTAVQS